MKYTAKSTERRLTVVKNVLDFLTALLTFGITAYTAYIEWKENRYIPKHKKTKRRH